MATHTPTPPGTRRGGAVSGCNLSSGPVITLSIANRHQIETAIDTLIAMLDAADGDPDLEVGADAEPDDGEDDDRPEAMAFWPGSAANLNRCGPSALRGNPETGR